MYCARAKSELKKLDNIQSRALRICCGAIRSTSLDAIKVEIMPLDLRREKLVIMYWVNLQGKLIKMIVGNIKRMEEIVLDGNMNSGSMIVVWRMK